MLVLFRQIGESLTLNRDGFSTVVLTVLETNVWTPKRTAKIRLNGRTYMLKCVEKLEKNYLSVVLFDKLWITFYCVNVLENGIRIGIEAPRSVKILRDDAVKREPSHATHS